VTSVSDKVIIDGWLTLWLA